jgi:dephospho-CoA kinase
MRASGVRVIGLTGGIATGKSSVGSFFQKKGVEVIDADQLSREAVKPGNPIIERISALFGDAVVAPDGTLDRKRVGALVFSDSSRRRQLEAIIHPEIKRLAEERIAQAAADGRRIVFYMAPLLIEANATDRVDEIWVVSIRPEIQIKRLMVRDGISRDDALRIINSQMPLADKERLGRVVIDNSGTPEETDRILNNLWTREIEGSHE